MQEDHAAGHEGVSVADGIGQESPDPGSQGHAQEYRHLHEAQAVSQSLPGDNGGDHGDRGRNRAGGGPREEPEEQQLPHVGDEPHGEGDDGAAEHGPLDHDLPPVPVGEPSPERGEEGHDQARGGHHDPGPDGDEPFLGDPQLPDVKGEKGQDEGKADDGQELGDEHDVERQLPGLPCFRCRRVWRGYRLHGSLNPSASEFPAACRGVSGHKRDAYSS